MYIYIYIYIKGTNGLGTHGVTANFVLFDRGTFWALPCASFYLPKSARAYLFSRSVKIHYLCCSGPISVDPICQQPRNSASPPTVELHTKILHTKIL